MSADAQPAPDPDSHDVGSVHEVLAALAEPVRLEMVRRLLRAGAPVPCAELYDDVGKSTASHHFKILREAGLTDRYTIGGQVHQHLRVADIDARYPQLLETVTRAAAAQPQKNPPTNPQPAPR